MSAEKEPSKIRFPWLIIIISSVIVFCYCSGSITQLLEFRRMEIYNGEYWRLIGGHFTHWSTEHLFWDLIAFIIAIAALNRLKSWWTILCFTVFSAFFISSCVFIFHPGLETYRGLSGIDTALFTYFSLLILAGGNKFSLTKRIPAMLLIIGICLKVGYEFISSKTLFVSSLEFIPLPSAHLSGIISAVIFFFLYQFVKRSKKQKIEDIED